MDFDPWGNEPWFRNWRYGILRLGFWPINWKGYVAALIFLAMVAGTAMFLGGHNPDDGASFVILIPIAFFFWLAISHTDRVNLRDKPRTSREDAFPNDH